MEEAAVVKNQTLRFDLYRFGVERFKALKAALAGDGMSVMI